MLHKLKQIASRNLVNMPGWRTDRKIVVFESDDWGMIRMASKEAYNWFLKKGYEVDQCPYNRNDALESNEDLELLFDVLASVKDKHGDPAIFTANCIVANPNFTKIEEAAFQTYHYESIIETLNRYPNRDRVADLYRQGMAERVFRPQFHGREHLNVNRWMQRLNVRNKILRDAFSQGMYTVHKTGAMNSRRDNLDAFGLGYKREWVGVNEIIESGIHLFEKIWGFRPLSFIAPCYTWTTEVEKKLAEKGIRYIQGTHVQRVPLADYNRGIKRKYHYLGQPNENNQRYIVRNAHFEPTESSLSDQVGYTLQQIRRAFRYKKPAVISSHRVNYIGSIHPENRDKNLMQLRILLKKIIAEFPEVEFMSSDQLGQLILNEK